MKNLNITIVGLGYVGLSNLCILSQKHFLLGIDIDKNKLDKLRSGFSPLAEDRMNEFIQQFHKNLNFSTDLSEEAFKSDVTILALPTNYDERLKHFDTSVLEEIISRYAMVKYSGIVVIRSTISFGFTQEQRLRHPDLRLVFAPEFLREGKAIQDQLSPSRMIFSGNVEDCDNIYEIYADVAEKSFNKLICSYSEAEAIKLFSNTFLAARVAIFNEIDNFCHDHKLSSKNVILGISKDPRIGEHYNNPSFGYGGYCLPKDTLQTQNMINQQDSPIISSINLSNDTRKRKLAKDILDREVKHVGILGLSMKSGSDNYREAAIIDLASLLKANGCILYLHEPNMITDLDLFDETIDDIHEFNKKCDIILTNRISNMSEICAQKLFTRDIFGND